MNETVFISGPYDSSRRKLIEYLLNNKRSINEYCPDIDFCNAFPSLQYMNVFEKYLLLLYHKIYVGFSAEKYNYENYTNNIMIVNESVYDVLAHIKVEYTLGNMSVKSYNILHQIGKNGISMNPYTIIINPPVNTILSKLNINKVKGKSVDEKLYCSGDNSCEYIKRAHSFFEEFKNNENIFYLTDIKEEDLKNTLNWLNSITKKKY